MKPNVLLVTGIVPGTQGVGQLFLRDLVISYPHDKIACYGIIENGMMVNSPDLSWLKVAYERRPREAGIWRFGRLVGKITGLLAWNYTRLFKLRSIRVRIVEFARQNHSEVIWVILSTPTLIAIARNLAKELSLPLVVTIWDPPKMITDNLRFARVDEGRLMDEFSKVLQATYRCGVASENMAEEYAKKYGVRPVVQMMPAPSVVQPTGNYEVPANKDTFTIGFGGSFYTIEVWKSLLWALDSVNWEVDGKLIYLKILATQMPFDVQRKERVAYLGWQSVHKAIEVLADADVLYLPYWFDEEHSEYVRLSFPGKMGTYLRVAKPVLFHGPGNSTPAKFIKKYSVGCCCHSTDSEDIINALRRFVNNSEIYRTTRENATAITNTGELSQDHFKNKFEELITV